MSKKQVEAFVQCRTIGHQWDQVPSTRRPSFGVLMTLRCECCGGERYDIINQFNGELLDRNYSMPEGYKQAAESHQPRSDWRREFLRQRPVVRKLSEPEAEAS